VGEEGTPGATVSEGGIDYNAAADDIGAALFGDSMPKGGQEEPPAEPEPTGAPPKSETNPPGVSGNNPPAIPAAPVPNTAPSTWSAAAKEAWAKADPIIKAEVLKREADFFKGIEGYKADAAAGKSFQRVLQPYAETLRQYGVDPLQEVQQLLAAHHSLALGTPGERLSTFKALMQEYKIDPAQLMAVSPPLPPEVQALQQRLESIESAQFQREQEAMQQRRAEIQQEITKFASDPANVYFKELEKDIAFLLQTGAAADLKSAYESAIWMNPAVRQKELDRQQAERTARAEQERKAKLEAAKKAARVNAPAGGQPNGTVAAGSMDDTLKETLAEIRSRS
jgi:hypothetical protein